MPDDISASVHPVSTSLCIEALKYLNRPHIFQFWYILALNFSRRERNHGRRRLYHFTIKQTAIRQRHAHLSAGRPSENHARKPSLRCHHAPHARHVRPAAEKIRLTPCCHKLHQKSMRPKKKPLRLTFCVPWTILKIQRVLPANGRLPDVG